MTQYLGLTSEQLNANDAYWTAKEIARQPHCWQQLIGQLEQESKQLKAWLTPLLAKPNLRIILTGAGTSAYVGKTLAPYLTQQFQRLFESVATTDIVANPQQYLLADVPTLMISYGRSGNSPESVATTSLADQILPQCWHLVVTCNPEGELARFAQHNSHCYHLAMPAPTLDQSFAMTSSFTSMYLATLCVFAPQADAVPLLIQSANQLITQHIEDIKHQASRHFTRLVFLGSGCLQGIATEAALKLLELTASQIDCYSESALGFRHGPKSIIDSNTLVIVLSENTFYTSLYDQDIISELNEDGLAAGIISLSPQYLQINQQLSGAWLGLVYILYCQMLAFFASLNKGVTPDNPCPTGEVNRVVQGVTIHPYEQPE